ncbi:hypothetical protein [Streptomyces soliscabiei]|uniref:hypothetical protein n=1 Tax=Streptomyces soliscabiei TaxID=588897 RepID=UPI0029BE0C66|nr:hypothetical protein [Streptomyces sp. NY05-11A]MDX2681104.1 hypothetical protein [Streptomyces sp. NY05-11A]
MPSRVPELIDALVALAETEVAPAGVRIADGPEATDDAAPDWLIVGYDGDPNGDFEAAQTAGGWSDLSTGREETFQVTVAVVVNRGDTDVKAARDRAYEIAGLLAAPLRADPSVGLPSLEAAIEATRLLPDQTDQGAQARLLLMVAGRAFV